MYRYMQLSGNAMAIYEVMCDIFVLAWQF